MSAVLHVNGWNVAELNGEPTVKDTDLAERLGYKNTRQIRELIKRMIEKGQFGGVVPYDTIEKHENGKNNIEVFYLNEKQALKVIAKSETDIADKIMDEVIDVFLAYRNGKLKPTLTQQEFTMKSIAEMANSFLGVENQIKEVKNEILELKNTTTLNYSQQQKIQHHIAIRVAEIKTLHNFDNTWNGKIFAFLHRTLKSVFMVGSYKDIPTVKFSEAILTIQNQKFNLSI